MNRNQKILLGLLAIFVLVLTYRLTNPFEQGTVDRLTYAPAKRIASGKVQSASPQQTHVRLDLLRSPPRESVSIQRDLFRPPTVAGPANESAGQPDQPPEPAPKTAREQIQEHFEGFRVFGSYRRHDKTYIFLEREKQVLVVTRGDRIDGRYEIVDVGEDAITIVAQELEEPLQIDFEGLMEPSGVP